MARLPEGDKEYEANRISRLLQKCDLGLSEKKLLKKQSSTPSYIFDRRKGLASDGCSGKAHGGPRGRELAAIGPAARDTQEELEETRAECVGRGAAYNRRGGDFVSEDGVGRCQ